MNEQPELRPGAIFEGDTVVAQLPDGDWLLMAPHDTHKRLEWGCWGERIGTCGTGCENTDKLVKAGSPAAVYCRTGLHKAYDLPSRGELTILYQQRDLLGLEGLGWAWSSTELSSNASWLQRFSDGPQYTYSKYYEYWVVPVRRISSLQPAEDEVTRLRERRDALRAEVEALRQDAARIEFLAREARMVYGRKDEASYQLSELPELIQSKREECQPDDLRRAIDEAMEAAE